MIGEPSDRVATIDEVVRRHILHVLQLTGFHKSRTAQLLGIDRTTLWKKLREYGVEA
jgi:transcriptional regulator of acetoin/glycerol metabolism